MSKTHQQTVKGKTVKAWAVARNPYTVPLLVDSRKNAETEAEPGERLFRVTVTFEREVTRRKAAP